MTWTPRTDIQFSGGLTGLPVPNRNLLYNGAMQVAQRGTSRSGITQFNSGYFTADRWRTQMTENSVWTQSVVDDGPTGSGFTKSLKMLVTTAQTTPGYYDGMQIEQKLEGLDCQRVKSGTSTAEPLTLSFWVKSNVTGTYVAYLYNMDSNYPRRVSHTYTINSSGVWEFKTITFPPDTDPLGAMENNNTEKLSLTFALTAGSGKVGGSLATQWVTNQAFPSNYNTWLTGQTNLAAAVNNYWQITGVQLETGPVATEFEHRSFGDELARCQRYFQRYNGIDHQYFPQGMAHVDVANRPETVVLYSTKRAQPTISASSPSHFTALGGTSGAVAVCTSGPFTYIGTGTASTNIFFGVASGIATYDPCTLVITDAAGYLDISAEL